MHPLIAICIVLFAIGLAFGLMRLLTHRTPLSPELTRKGLHIALGLGCLSFPWLFDAFWPVLVLCGFTLVAFAWIRCQKGSWRSLLHGVTRTSWGELCFPIAVTILFGLMQDPIVDYVVPLLVLTLADAIGALVGVRYGQSKFTTDEGHKSLEGSAAFFIVAFLSTHLCLLLGTDIDRLDSVLIAVIIGILVMLIEAIAWRGLDNLFIPLATYLLVHTYMEMELGQLLGRLGLLLGILLFFGLLSRRTYAKDSVLIASTLVLYLIWAVGGWLWALSPIIVAIVYCLLCPPRQQPLTTRHGLADLAALAGAGLIWLFLSVASGSDRFELAFIASWGAQIAMLFTAFLCAKLPSRSTVTVITASTLIALSALSLVLYLHFHQDHWIAATATVILASGLASAALWFLEWKQHGTTQQPGRPARQFLYGSTASTLGLIQFLF